MRVQGVDLVPIVVARAAGLWGVRTWAEEAGVARAWCVCRCGGKGRYRCVRWRVGDRGCWGRRRALFTYHDQTALDVANKDIAAGQAIGLKTIFVDYHYAETYEGIPADFTVKDTLFLTDIILKG